MGGAVSSGRDNNELIDNLMEGNYIRTGQVEKVFRAVDRGDYMNPHSRDQAYKDLAWRHGLLHLSAPCIYSEVMEGLELREGLSFLNVGSGTGYLSTMVSLILGPTGISHGIEVHSSVITYANKKLKEFIAYSSIIDELDFCEPKFFLGNGLSMAPMNMCYDRVYVGAGCPPESVNYFKQLLRVGGILVLPQNDTLLQIRRMSENLYNTNSLLHVSFAQLQAPSSNDQILHQLEMCPAPLQQLARGAVRRAVREGVLRQAPALAAPLASRRASARRRPRCPRRICIPVDDDSDIELNALHDLDAETGANEMNALLNLVLSMGQNRVAGSINFEGFASSGSSEPNSNSNTDTDENTDSENENNDPDARDNDRHEDSEDNVQRTTESEKNKSNDAENKDNIFLSEDCGGTSKQNAQTDNEYKWEHCHRKTSETNNSVGAIENEENMDVSTERNSASEANSHKDNEKEYNWALCRRNKSVPSKTKKNVRDYFCRANNGVPYSKSEDMMWDNSMSKEETAESENECGDDSTSKQEMTEADSENEPSEIILDKPRVKLDSGIGEGNSPETTSSGKTGSTSNSEHDESHGSPSGSEKNRLGRATKRSHHALRHSRSSSEASRRRRRSSPQPQHHREDVRRDRLSAAFKQAVRSLPLPAPLCSYVNFHRSYDL